MIINKAVEIVETAEHGPVLLCRDMKMADQFEDFLAERCFVLFNISLKSNEVSFFFGQASTPSKVHELYERFADGSVVDISTVSVKEYVPSTHPKAPAGVLKKVKFPDALEGSKGYKCAPSAEELEIFGNA